MKTKCKSREYFGFHNFLPVSVYFHLNSRSENYSLNEFRWSNQKYKK